MDVSSLLKWTWQPIRGHAHGLSTASWDLGTLLKEAVEPGLDQV